jgi:hypothetical protein
MSWLWSVLEISSHSANDVFNNIARFVQVEYVRDRCRPVARQLGRGQFGEGAIESCAAAAGDGVE